MVVLAVVVETRQVVAAALVGFGSALMSLAVLLPRLVGQVKFGAQGFEAQLIAAVQEQAEAQGLSPEETLKVIEVARTETDAWGTWLEGILSETAQRADGGRQPIARLARQLVEREREREGA